MNAIDKASPEDAIRVGKPMPRIATVRPAPGLAVAVTWAAGPRVGQTDIVDLAPIVMTLRFYAPLRHDPALFATVATTEDGSALSWDQGKIDMAATTVERLTREAMSPEDFRSFLTRHHLTLDATAAILGISRRQAAYFAKGRPVPRLVALACAGYEARRAELAA
jgi:hypothetical protein